MLKVSVLDYEYHRRSISPQIPVNFENRNNSAVDKTADRVFNNNTDYYNTYTRVLISNKLTNTFKKKIADVYFSSLCKYTRNYKKKKKKKKILQNI